MTAGTSVVCLDCGIRGPTEQVEQYECGDGIATLL
jgi:hypothetical protein